MASTARRAAATRMADAAARLLDTLDDGQRSRLSWPWPSDDERRSWFYTPTDHGGLPLAEMSAGQQRLSFALMATGLSTAGYVTATTIIGLENVLDHVEGFGVSWGRERGRDPGLYYVRVFGRPGTDESWAWRIGGHHVSLNFSIIDGELAGSTPLFFGADPASAPLLGPHPLRPLAGVEDLARELVRGLGADEARQALVTPRAPSDLVTGNRPDLPEGARPLPLRDVWRGRLGDADDAAAVEIQRRADEALGLGDADLDALSLSDTPKGLAASALSTGQKDMLRDLLDRYVRRLPDGVADEEAGKYAGALLDEVHLLWAGGLEPGQPHYYRLQGPTLLAEYDNVARDANHVHTVWRDPRGDWGDVLAAHRDRHH